MGNSQKGKGRCLHLFLSSPGSGQRRRSLSSRVGEQPWPAGPLSGPGLGERASGVPELALPRGGRNNSLLCGSFPPGRGGESSPRFPGGARAGPPASTRGSGAGPHRRLPRPPPRSRPPGGSAAPDTARPARGAHKGPFLLRGEMSHGPGKCQKRPRIRCHGRSRARAGGGGALVTLLPGLGARRRETGSGPWPSLSLATAAPGRT